VRNINKPDVRNKTLDVREKTTCEEGRKTTTSCKEEKPFRGCEKEGKEKA
jgi:hypothetical protein